MKLTLPILTFLLVTFFGYSQNQLPIFTSEDVFQLEYAADPQVSPDGEAIVYARSGYDIMKDRKMARLWIIQDNKHRKLTSRDVNESSPRWSPSGDRIAFVSSSDHGSELFIYWLETGQLARITQLERSPRSLSWSPDGQQIAFSMHVPEKSPMLVAPLKAPKGAKWADPPRVTTRVKHEADGSGFMEPGFSHIFVVPAEGGTPRQVTSGDFHHRGGGKWIGTSTLVFSANRGENWEYEFRNSELYTVNIMDGSIKQLTDRNGPDRSPAVSPDGKKIAYVGFDDKIQTYQLSKLYIMNSDGTDKKEIQLDLDRSVSNPTWDIQGKGVYFQYDDKGNTKIGYTNFSGDMMVIAKDLGGTSLGRPYGGGSFSVSKKGNPRIVYTKTTPEHPSEIAILGDGYRGTQLITQLNKDLLDFRALGKVEEIWYKSTVDQREVQGWIVKPPYFDSAKKYPLIVENHGGPISNYGDRFSPEIQLYAAAGYVVFYPNPRGSTSYGEEFGNLLYHNYPGEDYNDVMDGVDAVLQQGYVSADSLYVTGGSAGGIMTAWMIGKNNRFRAAAVIKPVMNWVSKTLTADNYYGYSFYRYPDWPWENIEAYMKFSPISLVGNIETPTLVMVGTADLRTPLSEAKQLYHALKLRKIETALVEVPGAYHFIAARPSQLVTKISHILAWFELYK